MPITPFPINLFINHSGIGLNAEKWGELPSGWGIAAFEGSYREAFRRDGDAACVIHWQGPWATRKLFADWALGYTVNTAVNSDSSGYTPTTLADIMAATFSPFVGGYTRGVDGTGTAGKLRRVIPTQHPEMPWLYADQCELVKTPGIATDRTDISVLKNAAALPYTEWDATAYDRPLEGPVEDPNADPDVVAARTALDATSAALDLVRTFPMGLANLSAFLVFAGGAGIGFGAEAPAVAAAPSIAAIDRLATGTPAFGPAFGDGPPTVPAVPPNGTATIFLLRLRIVEEQLQTQQIAFDNALAAAKERIRFESARLVVPMIYYTGWRENVTVAGPELEDNDDTCIYAVTYRPVTYEIRTDRDLAQNLALLNAGTGELERYVTRYATDASKAFQVPNGGQLKFDDPTAPVDIQGQAVPSPGTALFPLEELIYVWHDVPDVPHDALAACRGKINSVPFDGARGARTYTAKKLLCETATWQRSPRTIRGRVLWNVSYKFLHNPNGWNKFPAANGNFYSAAWPDGTSLYKGADFAQLFTPPLPIDYQALGLG